MLTSASPGRGGDGAGADRAQPATGSSTTIGKSAALSVGRSPALAQRCGRCGSERSAEFGSVYRFALPSRARARRRRFQRALTPTDLHRPAGRRCGCWPTSTVLFSGIVVGRFGGGRWSSGIGADADVGFAWSAAAMVPAPIERSQLPGHRQRSANSAAPTVVALSRARSALRPLRLGKISGIWQRLPLCAALTRARETAPIPARSDADRPAPAGSAALRLLADVDISF